MKFLGSLSFCGVAAAVMNKGGVPYQISNPPGSTPHWHGKPGQYSTDFEHNVAGTVEHFDVYGEVQTQYSQVYWTRNAPIPLPPALVERFKGKVMAITGYEVDQVTHSGPKPGYTQGADGTLGGFSCYPSCSETDQSVPIYNAYNHHYFSWLMGKDSELYERESPTKLPNPTRTGIRDLPHNYSFPTNIVFKENPGGEFRKSYHGYPSGYAQLVANPNQWVVEPMQIDTHNRKHNITQQTGYTPDFLPQIFSNRSETNLGNSLSPLIECPCSTRISKMVVRSPALLVSGTCGHPITTSSACSSAAADLTTVGKFKTVNDLALPFGCILQPTETPAVHDLIFNSATDSTADCSTASAPALVLLGKASLGGLTNLTLSLDSHTANITFSGPDGNWFGVGFGAGAMADLPYTLIVDGSGTVTERKLGNHDPGTLLKPSITVVTSSANNGIRTVRLTRPLTGASSDYFTFPSSPSQVKVITAIGSTPDLSYHKARTVDQITVLPSGQDACVCQPKNTSYISYMNQTKEEYAVTCVDEPRSDMLKHGDGTGRDTPNMACTAATYHGGLHCCKHTWFLTDLEQSSQIPDQVDTYYLKWRYYFQEYTPRAETKPASHQHLHHWVFLIDADVNDYEEDNANYGDKSIGKITAHLTARDMGLEDTPSAYNKLNFFVMTPHCHAPNCIREELWNADTNEILCNVTANYGDITFGSTKKVFNEANYVAIPPCIFGYQAGLQSPFSLTPDTKIYAVKYFNNTFRHTGQMAQWTGLMTYDTDPF
mmetsp:Transcript_41397/g.81162  ORF Transcript_41397/g.81162 Transcript_41397/m.81162 type:complete len:771 (+) Transcript_41397:30-2342(+)|eukprot:CAMPEP_0175135952 /NCGR_PEP_ID=MMETSP0087-20121206/9010_1 /TAXON_ID=136419 /ORGANISM="Unknown Unknown, Strain D1" /LENGTH=770 /DNA_ID=CAMNT_0016418663 /DNA_START=24 /DNA_END=2336 /DNA_ORIENTATION=+